jgi:hypothetical protein
MNLFDHLGELDGLEGRRGVQLADRRTVTRRSRRGQQLCPRALNRTRAPAGAQCRIAALLPENRAGHRMFSLSAGS